MTVPADLHGTLARLGRGYVLPGRARAAWRLDGGRIHESIAAFYGDGDTAVGLLHQRLNAAVFDDLEQVMRNIERVCGHLAAKLAAAAPPEPQRRALRLLPARGGANLWIDERGDAWRTFHFIDRSVSHVTAGNATVAFGAAQAFGRLLADLADLPPPRLAETIPRFHDTGNRLEQLRGAVAADRLGRAAGARREIDALLDRRGLAGRLTDAAARGTVPLRTVHNDTKIANVLFDAHSGEPLCVVDLDTVMPGLSLFDFGDLVRSAAASSAEEGNDPAPELRRELFRALVEGYRDGAGTVLTAAEVGLMAIAPAVITFELALRYLTDHLRGDCYFAVTGAGDNLERCRRQLALLRSIERQRRDMERIVAS